VICFILGSFCRLVMLFMCLLLLLLCLLLWWLFFGGLMISLLYIFELLILFLVRVVCLELVEWILVWFMC